MGRSSSSTILDPNDPLLSMTNVQKATTPSVPPPIESDEYYAQMAMMFGQNQNPNIVNIPAYKNPGYTGIKARTIGNPDTLNHVAGQIPDDTEMLQSNVRNIDVDAIYGEDGTWKRKLNEFWGGSMDKFGNTGFGAKDAIGGIKSIWDMYNAYETNKLMKDDYNMRKKYLAANYGNQAKLLNDKMKRDEIVRGRIDRGEDIKTAKAKVENEEWKKKHLINEKV